MNPSTAPLVRSGFRRWLIPGILGAGLGLWWSWHRSAPPPPTALPELNRTNLVRSQDLWFPKGSTNPFTGILVDFYPGGGRMSRSAVSNGQLAGLSEGWFTNGQQQVRESYRTNVADGPRTRWYPDGHKLSEAVIVAGKIQGQFRRWHQDGSLAEEIPMRDGQPEGVGRVYYPSGYLQLEEERHNGQVIRRQEWQDGETKGK